MSLTTGRERTPYVAWSHDSRSRFILVLASCLFETHLKASRLCTCMTQARIEELLRERKAQSPSAVLSLEAELADTSSALAQVTNPTIHTYH